MKLNFIIIICLFVSACAERNDSFYGNKIDKSDVMSYSEINDLLKDKDEAEVKIEGEIVTTCKMKGCWMSVRLDNGEEMRVTFKDYGFFVPKDSVSGKKTIIAGTIKKDITDVATLRHFAEDEGRTAEEVANITEPKEELTFVASGVIIEG